MGLDESFSRTRVGIAKVSCDLEKLINRVGSHNVKDLSIKVDYCAPNDIVSYGVLVMLFTYRIRSKVHEEKSVYRYVNKVWLPIFNL